MKVIVSSVGSIPPPKNISLLSNSSSLTLAPSIGSRRHPEPLPPTISKEITSSISKSCGSIKTSLTVPVIIGSTNAVVPLLTSGDAIVIFGGLTTS